MQIVKQQIDFEDFHYRFISTPFADLRDRPKLTRALRLLCERMPVDVYKDLPLLTIFAPGKLDYGQVMPAPSGLLIYFAPDLEKSQAQSNFTVAHEFAHAALNHGTPEWFLENNDTKEYLEQDHEVAADKLVERWGYRIPAYRKHRSSN